MKNNLIIIFVITMFIWGIPKNLESRSNHEQIIERFIGIIDTCLSPELKECIVTNGLLESGYGKYCTKLTWKDIRVNNRCFELFDDIIETDSVCREYFGDLLVSNHRYWDWTGYIIEKMINIYHKHLNEVPYDFDKEIDSIRVLKHESDSARVAWLVADTINGIYIPKDIDDAIMFLNSWLHPDDIETVKNYKTEDDATGHEHFGISYYLRNMWKLGATRLLRESGLFSADNISTLIMRAYYRCLNNQPINLDELIEEHRIIEIDYK